MATVEEITERYPQFAPFFEHPDLGPLLQEAADAGWTAIELQGRLHETEWWNRTWADARQVEVLKATDPAEYEQRRQQAAFEVQTLFRDLGVDWRKNEALHISLAEEWLKRGKDDWYLYAELGRLLEADHSLIGADGTLAAKVNGYREQAAQYLLDYDDTALTKMAVNNWRRMTTDDAVRNNMRMRAIREFGHLEDELARGLTVRELASPVVNTVARTLEINPDDIDLASPKYRQLIDYVDSDSGKRRMMTTAEAERFARRQESFQHTKTARDEAYEMADSLLKEMGAVR